MKNSKSQILLGMFAACLPIPILWDLFARDRLAAGASVLDWYTVLLGVPAAFLFFGYQIARKSNDLSYSSFTRGGAVTGIALGLITILPLALPLIYFRGADQTALGQFLKLIAVFAVIASVSTLCAYLFWLAGIKPPGQSLVERK